MSLFLVVMATAVSFAEPAYLDNRSTAEDLVHSLYDAVNKHEYARAFDYFSAPPAKDFATFAKGYEDTDHVDVLTGTVWGDGAAGSLFGRQGRRRGRKKGREEGG